MYQNPTQEDLRKIFYLSQWEIIEMKPFKMKVRREDSAGSKIIWVSKRQLRKHLKHNCTEDDLYRDIKKRYRLKW